MRKRLIIDPGPRTVTGVNQRQVFTGGTFMDIDVPLGEFPVYEFPATPAIAPMLPGPADIGVRSSASSEFTLYCGV